MELELNSGNHEFFLQDIFFETFSIEIEVYPLDECWGVTLYQHFVDLKHEKNVNKSINKNLKDLNTDNKMESL